MATSPGTLSVRGTPALRQLADEDLMPLMAGGDPYAFEIIYERHASAAFSLAARICGVGPAAEEATQEAFLAIWRSGARYDRSRGSVRTWLLGVVHNRAIDMLRRATVHDRLRADDEQAAEDVEAPERTDLEVARLEEARSMRALVSELPPDQLRVIELAYYSGFSQEQIAQILRIPLGTVKGRMRLALEKMRASLVPSEMVV